MKRGGERLGNRLRRGRTARDAQVDREDRFKRPSKFCLVAEEIAAQGAVSERGDEPGLGHRFISCAEGPGHPCGDRPGDEQHIGVARRGNDIQPVLLEIVERIRGCGEFVLTAIAGASVDVTDRERATPTVRCPWRVAAESLQVVEQHEHCQRSVQA